MGNDADTLLPNSYPVLNQLVLFTYPKTKHIALITKFEEKGFWIVEGNFLPCKKSVRFVEWNNPFISGFVDTGVIERYLTLNKR